MNDASRAAAIRGEEHWTSKDGNVKLFMFEKCGADPNSAAGTILFVHGSSMASQPPPRCPGGRAPYSLGGAVLPPPWLRLLVRGYGRLRPLDQGSRQQRPH